MPPFLLFLLGSVQKGLLGNLKGVCVWGGGTGSWSPLMKLLMRQRKQLRKVKHKALIPSSRKTRNWIKPVLLATHTHLLHRFLRYVCTIHVREEICFKFKKCNTAAGTWPWRWWNRGEPARGQTQSSSSGVIPVSRVGGLGGLESPSDVLSWKVDSHR